MTLLLAGVFGCLLGVAIAYFLMHYRQKIKPKLSNDYFKGLNFLLNEEPDKAIEVFIRALEVDSETVELHLALGGLFRKKGQLDRATRIHQNLIARPNLTNEQRLQAIYELAQDYFRVGLFDRAENLFLELTESSTYRLQAIQGLSDIYQKEKEWQKAIHICQKLEPINRASSIKRVAHYWCELAEEALFDGDITQAENYVKEAGLEQADNARVVLLQGQLHYEKAEYKDAINVWQSLIVNHSNVSGTVLNRMLQAYIELGDAQKLNVFLKNLAELPFEKAPFRTVMKILSTQFDSVQLIDRLIALLPESTINRASLDYLHKRFEANQLSIKQQKKLLENLLLVSSRQHSLYACSRCGFESRSFSWLCPSCEQWDSFNG